MAGVWAGETQTPPPQWVPPSLARTTHCLTAASPDGAEIQPCCGVKHLHVLSRTRARHSHPRVLPLAFGAAA